MSSELVETLEELNALPVGTGVRVDTQTSARPSFWVKTTKNNWRRTFNHQIKTSTELLPSGVISLYREVKA